MGDFRSEAEWDGVVFRLKPLQNLIFSIVVKNKFLKFQLVIFFEICRFRGFAKVSVYYLSWCSAIAPVTIAIVAIPLQKA